MKALVVYESMFGSTHELAEAIARGLRRTCHVEVARADEVGPAQLAAVDLLVAGGPPHGHTMSTSASRHEAASWSEEPEKGYHLDGSEMVKGLRELFDTADAVPPYFAAFDTRSDVPRLLSGAASVRIGKELRQRGSRPVVPPESFLVDRFVGLKNGEAERGRMWGEQVAQAAAVAHPGARR